MHLQTNAYCKQWQARYRGDELQPEHKCEHCGKRFWRSFDLEQHLHRCSSQPPPEPKEPPQNEGRAKAEKRESSRPPGEERNKARGRATSAPPARAAAKQDSSSSYENYTDESEEVTLVAPTRSRVSEGRGASERSRARVRLLSAPRGREERQREKSRPAKAKGPGTQPEQTVTEPQPGTAGATSSTGAGAAEQTEQSQRLQAFNRLLALGEKIL